MNLNYIRRDVKQHYHKTLQCHGLSMNGHSSMHRQLAALCIDKRCTWQMWHLQLTVYISHHAQTHTSTHVTPAPINVKAIVTLAVR